MRIRHNHGTFYDGTAARNNEVSTLAALHFRFGELFRTGLVFRMGSGCRRSGCGIGHRQVEGQGTAARQNDAAFDDVAENQSLAQGCIKLAFCRRGSGVSPEEHASGPRPGGWKPPDTAGRMRAATSLMQARARSGQKACFVARSG